MKTHAMLRKHVSALILSCAVLPAAAQITDVQAYARAVLGPDLPGTTRRYTGDVDAAPR